VKVERRVADPPYGEGWVMISPITTIVTFGFAGLIVGGIVLYLALMSRRKK
jgi:hypothetical protein